MNPRSVIESLEDEVPKREPWAFWIVAALALSVFLHFAFLVWALGYPIKIFSNSYYDEIVPRAFKVDRVEIDASLLDDVSAEAESREEKVVLPVPVDLPPEDIRKEKVPQPYQPQTPGQLGIENEPVPKVGLPDMKMPSLTEEVPFSPFDVDANAVREALISDQPKPIAQPAVTLSPAGVGNLGVSGKAVPEGYSDLDELLQQTGGLSPTQGPIFMPSDVLFAYNESALSPQAIVSLGKLGELIRKNPGLRFRIGGHTDSFGGDEYNARLSLARADSVRDWLVEESGVELLRLETCGYGSSKPLVSPAGSIEEQQPNRRVEIEILPPDGEN